RAFAGTRSRQQISNGGGSDPLWSPDGRELFFSSVHKLLAVDVKSEEAFSAGAPRVLFEGNYLFGRELNYDVTPDGKRFVVVKRSDDERFMKEEIRVVLNWLEEVRAKVGGDVVP